MNRPATESRGEPSARPSKGIKVAGTALALLLAVSLAANVLLAIALHAAFVKLQFARIFPLGYAVDESLPPAPADARPSMAFWGDSRALLWDKSALDARYRVLDFAHGSKTSAQLLLQLQHAPATRTDVAVVQIGINDLHPLGVLGSDKELVLRRLHENLIAIRDALLTRSDTVVLTTLFPPAPVPLHRRAAWDPRTPEYIADVNDLIRRAADGRQVLLLDAHAVLRDSDGWLSAPYVDADFFLHVNPAAYSRLNEAVRQLLAASSPLHR
jgi:hypothetical protein